jgi:MYXO-CTERM domain-containing protein
MQLLSTIGSRPGATAFLASTLFLASGASAGIAEINGGATVSVRSEVQSGGVFVDSEDSFGANVSTDPRFPIAPLDVSNTYAHGLSLGGAIAQQDVSTSLAFDSSNLSFGFSSSAAADAVAQGENAEARTRYDAFFSIEASTDTLVDVTITIDYTPGVNSDDVYAYIGVENIDALDTTFFEISGDDDELFATLTFRTMIEGGESIGINAEADYGLFSQADPGFDASLGIGFLGLSASVSVAPTPGSAALLGFAGIAASRRRR